MNNKAVVLLSGGLDSVLAARLMVELGVEAFCVNYYIEFAVCGGGPAAAIEAAELLGLPLEVFDITGEYLEILKNPRHGYGANVNPCIDCKILMLKKAKEHMGKIGASFLVTGEVLGERPMSQRRDALNIIEKNAGVRGILLRPLSAKLLEPTIPEKQGVVDRDKLFDIKGRSRKPQIALAEKFGITKYLQPAGGCLLTDPGFSDRVKDLIEHDELNENNLKLLKVGRHFRLGKSSKLVVGRNESENRALQSLVSAGDIVLKMKSVQGPICILRGDHSQEALQMAASIAAYHTKCRFKDEVDVNYWENRSSNVNSIIVSPATKSQVESFRINYDRK